MKSKILDNTSQVNAFMATLDHPLKAEIEAIRTIILAAGAQVTEGIKWNSPSFYYKGDLAVVHWRAQQHVHLVFPSGTIIPDTTGLLEGDYKDGRRMAYFRDMANVNARAAALTHVVQAWMKVKDSAADPAL